MNAFHHLSTIGSGNFAIAICGGLIIFCVAISCFNLFLHPLSRFPGPRLAALSGWWLVYHELIRGQSLTDVFSTLHQRYGVILPATLIVLPLLRNER